MSQNTSVETIKRQIDCALGNVPCEWHLKNARLVDVCAGRIVEKADIFIDSGKVVDAGVNCKAHALKTVDLKGAFVAPGFIDAHVHIESSMLSPVQFARLIVPFGTTTIIADPHEIANVLGMDGIRHMMAEAKKAQMTVRFMLPSCVPATPFETSGAVLKAEDLASLIDDPAVLGLAELMNVPGLLAKDEDLVKKVEMTLKACKLIDGHSPLTAGAHLSAYVASGVTSDHECSTPEEVGERVSRGMAIFMREGSAGQNVDALSRAVTQKNSRFYCLCTDDASPDDVIEKGHINNVLRRSVACGVDPIEAVRMATINTALHFGLKEKGAITPGRDADLVIFDNLMDFNVKAVWVGGMCVAEEGVMLTAEPEASRAAVSQNSVHIKPVTAKDFSLVTQSGRARVIGLHEGDLVNDHLIVDVKTDSQGHIACKDNPGLLKIAVIERHHATGNMGVGLLKGYRKDGCVFNGAIASTIAHDSHNIVVVGDNDEDMAAAVSAIEKMAGGVVLVRDGEILKSLPLEIAGLMTDQKAVETARRKKDLIETAHREFNIPERVHPVMTLGFLPLAVIPYLRITDLGLFDAVSFKHVDIDPVA